MRAKKNFIVVAYDISDSKRRGKVVKILEKCGTRVNFSVFECMLTDEQYIRLRKDILCKINLKEDKIAYYPVCVNCYSKIIYQLPKSQTYEEVTVV